MTFERAIVISRMFDVLNRLEICDDEFYIARIMDEYVGVLDSMGEWTKFNIEDIE